MQWEISKHKSIQIFNVCVYVYMSMRIQVQTLKIREGEEGKE